MKTFYNAPNKEVAATELDNLEKKWGVKDPGDTFLRRATDDLTVFPASAEIRKHHTTNLIENLN